MPAEHCVVSDAERAKLEITIKKAVVVLRKSDPDSSWSGGGGAICVDQGVGAR